MDNTASSINDIKQLVVIQCHVDPNLQYLNALVLQMKMNYKSFIPLSI